ncbi:MAG: hypothetical protein ACLP01_08075 [Solirubrobacteraceae bacterium]
MKRKRVWALLAEDPGLTLRELAAEAGCSATFAGDVRREFEWETARDWVAEGWARQARRDDRLAEAAAEICDLLAKAHAERGRELVLFGEFA